MPTYSYRCTKCEKVFDAFHSMTSTDKQYCPECGMEGTKLLSATSVIFKGSGFYSTDYRDSGYLEAKKQDNTSPATAAKTTTESGNSESKAPATKSETSAPEKKSDSKATATKSTTQTAA